MYQSNMLYTLNIHNVKCIQLRKRKNSYLTNQKLWRSSIWQNLKFIQDKNKKKLGTLKGTF